MSTAPAAEAVSLVRSIGKHSSGRCGYCKSDNDGVKSNWGMIAEQLCVSDYQYLIDRGWRRSGTYCYKPMNRITCCPSYTIRCHVNQFTPSRSHKRLLRMIAAFLNTGTMPQKRLSSARVKSTAEDSQQHRALRANLEAQGDVELNPEVYSVIPASDSCDSESHKVDQVRDSGDNFPSPQVKTSSPTSHGDTGDNNNSAAQNPSGLPKVTTQQGTEKARVRRWKRKQTKLTARSIAENRPYEEVLQEYYNRRNARLAKNRPCNLEDLIKLALPKEQAKHFIEVRIVRSSPPSAESEATLEESHKLFRRYQMTIHGDGEDEVEMDRFVNFLVDSPLVPDEKSSADDSSPVHPEISPPSFGSYHQQYWLDGKRLIAVGVIDLLPSCLSSVYLFYDPVYDFLRLGTYAALMEIAFVRKLYALYGPASTYKPTPQFNNFQYYYMGFYIRSCQKMVYKAQYKPSCLACPETYTWQPLQKCLQALEASPSGKYARFSPPTDVDVNSLSPDLTDHNLSDLVICHYQRMINQTRPRSKRHQQNASQEKSVNIVANLNRFRACLPDEYCDTLCQWAKVVGKRVIEGGHFQVSFH